MGTVTFVLADSNDAAVPDVVVRIWSEDRATLITEGTTGDDGSVTFDISEGTYTVRYFRIGWSFPLTDQFDVGADEETTFDVQGTDLNATPQSNDTLLCRVTGRYVATDGALQRGLPNLNMQLIWPRMFRGMPVLSTNIARAAVSGGSAVFDFTLIQGGIYELSGLHGMLPSLRVKAPALRACTLGDLLNPWPRSISWGGGAVSVGVGQTVTRNVTLTLRSGVQLPHRWHGQVAGEEEYHALTDWVTIETAETGVLLVSLNAQTGEMQLTGLTPGTATVRADLLGTLHDDVIPEVALTLDPLSVTVTG